MMESRDQEFQRLTLRAFEPSLDCRIRDLLRVQCNSPLPISTVSLLLVVPCISEDI